MASNKKKKVVKYRKNLNINVGIIIFGIIFVYLVSYVFMYITRDKISMYEVVYGKNAETTNKTYQALIIRDEQVYNATSSGYLNLFVRDGQKAAVGQKVYSIDESGKIKELLANASNEDNSISKNDLQDLKNKIVDFSTSYSDVDFKDVYSFKADIEASVMEYINMNTIENINEVLNNNDSSNIFKIVTADKSGIVTYVIDGFEKYNMSNLSADAFDKSKYNKITHKSSDLVESGTSIYKVINSEEWYLAFELNEEEVEKYNGDDRMKIKFIREDIESVGDFTIKNIDGVSYGIVTLNQYMVKFCQDRFVDIQIISDDIPGLKIPKTSLIEKEFFTIPVEYATEGGNSNETGFLMQVYDKNGNLSTKFITPEIYHKTESEYYVAKEVFEAGNVLVKPDSTETYVISNIAKLVGVYNINNGYCTFREVNIIGETSEYYIVESGTTYGLLVYDHIVLDSSLVDEDQIVYH